MYAVLFLLFVIGVFLVVRVLAKGGAEGILDVSADGYQNVVYFEKCKILRSGGIGMIKKMERFVSSLTDQEIDCQLKYIFDWARVYKELLETEKLHRGGNCYHNDSIIHCMESEDNDKEDESYEFENEFENVEEETIDFALAQMIREKVSSFSEEKTRQQIGKLRQIPTFNLSGEELATLKFEIESCELHLFEITSSESCDKIICPYCGVDLELNAKFCGKCGKQITL